MSEQEKKELFNKLNEAMNRATIALFERKAKLGENVVVAESDGKPMEISAEKALQLYYKAR